MTAPRWTPEEDSKLRTYREQGLSIKAIIPLLGRTKDAIAIRSRVLGITGAPGVPFTEEEDETLRALWSSLSVREIAKKLRRTEPSVRQRAHRLDLEGKDTRRWTPAEVAFLREKRGVLRDVAIARRLGRPARAVARKACKLGLGPPARGPGVSRPFTAEEDAYLRAQVATTLVAHLAEHLGCTSSRVLTRMRELGIEGSRRERNPRVLTAEEEAYLRTHYATMDNHALRKRFRCSLTRVVELADALGLPRKPRGRRGAQLRFGAEEEAYLRAHYATMKVAELARHFRCGTVFLRAQVERLGLPPKKRGRPRKNLFSRPRSISFARLQPRLYNRVMNTAHTTIAAAVAFPSLAKSPARLAHELHQGYGFWAKFTRGLTVAELRVLYRGLREVALAGMAAKGEPMTAAELDAHVLQYGPTAEYDLAMLQVTRPAVLCNVMLGQAINAWRVQVGTYGVDASEGELRAGRVLARFA